VREKGQRLTYRLQNGRTLIEDMALRPSEGLATATAMRDEWRKAEAAVRVAVGDESDTMAFTCSALSFMLQNLAKTVVVTGSQIPLSRSRSDGISNFLGALLIAGTFDIPEVTLYFAGHNVFKIRLWTRDKQ
jgi:lysophospholipase